MAKAFNLTAQLNLQGPNNLKPIISKIESALGKIKANINVDVKDTSIKNLKAITTNMQALSQAASLARTNVDSLNSSLANMGAGISRVGSVSSSAATGIDKIKQSAAAASKDVSRAGSAVEDFGKQAGLAVKRFAAFSIVTGVIYGLGSALTSALGEFVSFDKEIVRLSQVTGNSASELKGLKAEITNLSTSLGVGSQDLLLVSTTLAQAGLSAKDTTAALEALAKSALAPSFDNLTQTTEGAIAIMRQFGIQAGELEGALGSINSVAAAFAVESADIITAIQRTGGVFASASKGVSEGSAALNEFIAVFTSVRATTRESAETIATGLRTIFTRIQRGDTIDALKSYGIELTDLEGKFVGPYEATKRLSEGLKSLDPRDLRFSQVVEQLGGFRQIGKVIPLIQQFAVAQDALNVAQKGSGSLSKDAVTAQQSLAVQFTKTRESFLALVRDLADSSSFRAFVGIALTLTNSLIGLAGALKPLLPLLLAFAAVKIGSSLGNLGTGFLGGLRGNKKSEGGTIRGFARGGFVPGSGSGDTVPAMLEAGEFVIRKKAVDTLGASNLHRMNKSGGGSVGRYAGGGSIKTYSSGSKLLNEVQLDKSQLDKNVGQEFTPTGTNPNRFNPGDKFRFNIVPQSIDVDKLNQALPSVKDYKKQIDPSNRGYKFQDVVAEYVGAKLSDKKYARLDGVTMGGTPLEIKSYNEDRNITDTEIGTKIIASSILGSSNSEAGGILASKLTNTQLDSKINTIDLGAVRLYTDATKSTGAGGTFKRKNLGGIIQKFAGGTTGTGVKAQQGATAAEMYAALKSSKLRVPNESMFGQFAGKDLTDEIIRQVKRPPDASMSEEKRNAYRNTGDFVQGAYDKDQAVIAAKLAERIKKSTKVALVGLLPFGHSKNTGPIDINGRDVMIYERGLDKQYEQAVLNMQAGSAGVANQFATDIQKRATIGGLKEYDFDDTLVTGAGVFDADGKIDIPGYKNIKRVEEALNRKTVALTPLGVDLKQQLESDPTALANIRILTARPQSNRPALSKTLARLGLNIPETLITGRDGANKAVVLNPKATLVDDHAGNIEDVRKAGKKGIQYAPISALSQNASMATGQANIEGAFIEQAMAMFGAPIIPDAKATRAIDYPSGLGPAGSYFGLPPDWPAEVKRTIDSKSRATAIDEFTRYLFPKQVPVGKNLGGSIQKFAMGGASSDTVPAMLTPGEFVINKKAARSIGYGKLNKMNHADSVKGFASGGPVGGVQYFKGGGGPKMDPAGAAAAMEAFLYGSKRSTQKQTQTKESTIDIVAMQAAASIFTSAIENLGNQMGILDNVIGQGLVQGLTSATSSALAASTAMTLVGATKEQTQIVTSRARIGGAVSGVLSGVGTKGVASVEAANSKSITAFDKALQDSADGTKASSQALQTSFLQLYSTVSNNAPFLNFYENLNNLGNGIKATTEAYVQGSAAQVALTNSIPAIKDGLRSLISRVGGGKTMAGGALTSAFGGLLKAIPYVGVALAAFTAVTSVVGFFSARSKAAAENLQKLSKAALEASLRAPENQIGNENRDKTIALFKELTPAQQKTATSIINTKLRKDNMFDTESGLTPEQQKNRNIDPAFQKFNINPFADQFIQSLKAELLTANNIGSNDKRAKATLPELLTDESIGGKFRAIYDTRQKFAPGAIQRGDKITDNNMANFIIKNIFGELYKPAQNATQQAASDTQLSNIRAQAIQTAGNEVSRSSQNLINTLNLLDKAILKLSDTASIAMSDLDQSMNDALGKATVNTSSVLKTNSTTFGNLAGSSSAQIEQALSSTKQFAQFKTSSKDPNERSFNDQAQADFTQISNQIKIAANVAKELPIALNRISGDPKMSQENMKAIIASVFTIKDSEGKSVPISDSLNTIIGNMTDVIETGRKTGGTKQINLADIPNLSRELAKYMDQLNRAPEAMKNLTDSMITFMDSASNHINKLIAQEINIIDLKAQRDASQTDMASEMMRFSGNNPSLKMLNAPFDNQIRNLTGGTTDPAVILKNIDDAIQGKANASPFTEKGLKAQAAFTLTINKSQKALELLSTATIKFNNAMSEAARIKNEENNKGDILKQILSSTGDPQAFSEMRQKITAISDVSRGVGSQEQVRLAIANEGLVPVQFRQIYEEGLKQNLKMITGFNLPELAPDSSPEVKKALAVAATEAEKIGQANDAIIRQQQTVLENQQVRLAVIVDNFLVGFREKLDRINEGISGMSVVEKRSTVPITRLSAETQQRVLLNQRMMGNAIDQFPAVKQNPAVQSFLSLPTPTTTDELNTFKDNFGKMINTDLPKALLDMIHKIPSLILTVPPITKPPITKDTQESGFNQANTSASDKGLQYVQELNKAVDKIAAISNASVDRAMQLVTLVETTVQSFSQQTALFPDRISEAFAALVPAIDTFNSSAGTLSNAVGSIPTTIALTSNNTTSINFTGPLDLNTDSLEKAIANQTYASNTTTNGNPAMLGDLQVLGRTRSVANMV